MKQWRQDLQKVIGAMDIMEYLENKRAEIDSAQECEMSQWRLIQLKEEIRTIEDIVAEALISTVLAK